MEKNRNSEKGITLIVLIITVILLIILAGITIDIIVDDKVTETAEYTTFASNITTYQKSLDSYIVRQGIVSEDGIETNLTVTDKEEIKKIIPEMTDEDAEKFVIQRGKLRYVEEKVTDEEKGWLAKLGILVMTGVLAITFMVNGSVYQTVSGEEITFPETNPTSSEGNFSGWYYDEAGTKKATEGTLIEEDLTLYAKFGPYVATYMANGNVYKTISGNTLTFPETDPTSGTGNFAGWYYDEDFTNIATAGDTLSENTTLYAKWSSYITNKLNGATLLDGTYGTNSTIPDVFYQYIGSTAIVSARIVSAFTDTGSEYSPTTYTINDNGAVVPTTKEFTRYKSNLRCYN